MERGLDKIRRMDRQETDEAFLHELLENSVSCSIAVETGDFPFIHVAFFVYDKAQNDIVFHFSKYGFGGQQLKDGKKFPSQYINMENYIQQKKRLTLDVNIRVLLSTVS